MSEDLLPLRTRFLLLTGSLLSILCLFTALRIEWFNAHSTMTKLPRSRDSGKWRYASATSVKSMTELRYRRENNLKHDSVLTLEQQQEVENIFQNHWKNFARENQYLEFVSSFSLLQYLLAPALFVIGVVIYLPNQQKHTWGLLFLAVSAICGFLMLYRGYFTSLGW